MMVSNSQWFRILYDGVEYRDSLKKFKMTVKGLGIFLGIPTKLDVSDSTGKKPWDRYIRRTFVPTRQTIEYCVRDSDIVAEGISREWQEGRRKLTASSEAYHFARDFIGQHKFKELFPSLDKETDAFFRAAYRGGVCAVNPRFQGKDLENIYGYDVNGLYGWAMDENILPFGLPYEGEPLSENDLYVVRFKCEFRVKDGYFPFLQMKNNPRYIGRETEFIRESNGETELTLTCIDYEMFLKHYDVYNDWDYHYMSVKARPGLLSPIIAHNLEQKDYWSQAEHYDAYRRGAAKDNTNMLYGSFGLSLDVDNVVPVLKGGVLTFEHNKTTRKGRYIPMAVFITAYARRKTVTAIQANYDKWIYSDTDSMYLLGPAEGIEIHESHSGYWKYETWDGTPFKHGKFLRQKMYCLADENYQIYQKTDKYGNWISEMKCAGMPNEVKKQLSWDEFELGMRLEKLQHTVVKGGVVLKPHPYIISEGMEL